MRKFPSLPVCAALLYVSACTHIAQNYQLNRDGEAFFTAALQEMALLSPGPGAIDRVLALQRERDENFSSEKYVQGVEELAARFVRAAGELVARSRIHFAQERAEQLTRQMSKPERQALARDTEATLRAFASLDVGAVDEQTLQQVAIAEQAVQQLVAKPQSKQRRLDDAACAAYLQQAKVSPALQRQQLASAGGGKRQYRASFADFVCSLAARELRPQLTAVGGSALRQAIEFQDDLGKQRRLLFARSGKDKQISWQLVEVYSDGKLQYLSASEKYSLLKSLAP